MRIEPLSLPSYLYAQALGWDKDKKELIDQWKRILMFPGEDWNIPRGSEYVKVKRKHRHQTMLDPARVLSRLLCAKIDLALRDELVLETIVNEMRSQISESLGNNDEISENEKNIPLSWILRIAHKGGINWHPGEVLTFISKSTKQKLQNEIDEIKLYYPELFQTEKNEERIEKEVRQLIVTVFPKFLKGTALHISAPKFHKVWDQMINEKSEEISQDSIFKAKQQWSMKVNGLFEEICTESCSDAVVLQTGGGHVLLLTEESDVKEYASNLLEKMHHGFHDRQKWAPLLWASWPEGTHSNWNTESPPASKIIKDLESEYDGDNETLRRKMAAMNWATFQFGTKWKLNAHSANSSNSQDEGQHERFYLDVVGLGDHCWPKDSANQAVGEENVSNPPPQLPPKDWPVPKRDRDGTIRGFCNSRTITPVIESTFGLIIAKHKPSNIEAMGGDEIIFEMPPSDWQSLIENIEDHCLSLYSSVSSEPQRLLWWAICLKGITSNDFSRMKDIVKERMSPEKVSLTRFVNPIFQDFIDFDDDKDDPN